MAERSKAPDSRWLTFPLSSREHWYSGLLMKAWVQIPLLTNTFLGKLFLHKENDNQNILCAPSEVRTHDLEIMRLARCLLRYRGMQILFKITCTLQLSNKYVALGHYYKLYRKLWKEILSTQLYGWFLLKEYESHNYEVIKGFLHDHTKLIRITFVTLIKVDYNITSRIFSPVRKNAFAI